MKVDDRLIFEQYRTVTESNRQNPVVDEDGTKRWFNKHGERHREDGPAVERADGTKAWYINGKLHREDGPAIEYSNGSKWWYVNGKAHREDGPAIEYADGTKEWWVNNEYHSTIPEWVKALFIYKGHTPEKLGQERFDDVVRAFAQKMESMYED